MSSAAESTAHPRKGETTRQRDRDLRQAQFSLERLRRDLEAVRRRETVERQANDVRALQKRLALHYGTDGRVRPTLVEMQVLLNRVASREFQDLLEEKEAQRTAHKEKITTAVLNVRRDLEKTVHKIEQAESHAIEEVREETKHVEEALSPSVP